MNHSESESEYNVIYNDPEIGDLLFVYPSGGRLVCKKDDPWNISLRDAVANERTPLSTVCITAEYVLESQHMGTLATLPDFLVYLSAR